MPCSSRSVQDHSPSMSSLFSGGSLDQNKEFDAEFNAMVKEADRKIAKEKTKKKKGNQKKSFFDELLALQKQQIKIQREQNERYEKMMREALEEQEKVTKRNGKEIDSFFCNLGRFFLEVNNISIFFRKRVNGYVFICECVF